MTATSKYGFQSIGEGTDTPSRLPRPPMDPIEWSAIFSVIEKPSTSIRLTKKSLLSMNFMVRTKTSSSPVQDSFMSASRSTVKSNSSGNFEKASAALSAACLMTGAMIINGSIRFLRAVVGNVVWGDTSIIARVKIATAMAACASLIGCQPAYAGIVNTVSNIVQAGAAVSAASSMSDIAEAQKAAAENAARHAPTNPLFEKEAPLADAYCVNCHKPIFQIRDIDKYGFGHGDGVYCFGKLYFVKHRKNGRIKTIFCEKIEGGSYEKCYSGTSDVFRNPHKALEE